MLQLESRCTQLGGDKDKYIKIFFKFLKAMRIEEPLPLEAGKSWHESDCTAGILRVIQKQRPGLDLKQKEYRCKTAVRDTEEWAKWFLDH